MQYKIIYSKRKTLALGVNADDQIVVKASPRVSKSFIDSFVTRHTDWIRKQLEIRKVRKTTKKQFVEGESFLYLGLTYPLHIVSEYRSRIVFDNAFYLSAHKQAHGKRLLEQWYKTQAKNIIFERVKKYSQIMNLQYNRLSIKNTSSRWGSCSALGNLNFCWRLVMAPQEIIDYVIVHELAHLVHKNHSAAFWLHVGRFYPQWKQARKWLHANGSTLHLV